MIRVYQRCRKLKKRNNIRSCCKMQQLCLDCARASIDEASAVVVEQSTMSIPSLAGGPTSGAPMGAPTLGLRVGGVRVKQV